ncbi:MAG: preprotein translocase subunit SecY [Clostridia bacterium]
MLKTLINAWKIKDIRTKMLYTLILIVIYRLGCFIPVPGVNAEAIAKYATDYDILSFLNLLSGGSFGQFTIFAMGITPYITGSIIIQLLTIAIPSLERMAKEEDGKQKIERITRYVGIGLALVQSIGIVISLGAGVVKDTSFFTYATIGITCTAGTAFLVWLGERITEKGIGNGVSFIIFASICSQVPRVIVSFISGVFVTNTYQWWILPALLLIVVVLVAGVVMVDKAVRRISVQYAKKVVGRKMYGGQTSHIPLKANANGVMPLILAMTIIQFPTMIIQIADPNYLTNIAEASAFTRFYANYLSQGTVVYYLIYALLILGFAYFYTTITFNPVEISKNLQQNGGFIPGIRPGRPTSDYLAKITSRLTLFGAVFLMCIAIIPAVVMHSFGLNSMFGPTSILIMVSVALETSEQLESLMLMRHYKGFLG